MGGIKMTWRFRIAKIVLFQYIRWPAPSWPSWKSSNLICSWKSDWAKTWWEAFGRHRDSALLKPFCYDIHDGCHSSHLEDLQLLAHLELCSRPAYAVVCWHVLSLIRMSISNFSHFRHLHQNDIHDGLHGSHLGHLENLQITSAPKW